MTAAAAGGGCPADILMVLGRAAPVSALGRCGAAGVRG